MILQPCGKHSNRKANFGLIDKMKISLAIRAKKAVQATVRGCLSLLYQLQSRTPKSQAVSSYCSSPRPSFTNPELLQGNVLTAHGVRSSSLRRHFLKAQNHCWLELGKHKVNAHCTFKQNWGEKIFFLHHVYFLFTTEKTPGVSFRLLWGSKEHCWCSETENSALSAEGSLQKPVQTLPYCIQISNMMFTRYRAELTFYKY